MYIKHNLGYQFSSDSPCLHKQSDLVFQVVDSRDISDFYLKHSVQIGWL